MPQGRRYAGADADQRRVRRRADLVAAGLDLFGTEGYAAVPVKRICDHAGLTQRYFYESFTGRPALLAAVYADCVTVARAATTNAATEFVGFGEPSGIAPDDVPAVARATLGAFVRVLADDPRRARVMLVEVVGVNEELERIRLAAIHGWADLIVTLAVGKGSAAQRQRLAAIGLVGAVTQLLVDWYTTSSDPATLFDLDAVVDVSVDLFVAAYWRLLT